MNKFIHAVKLLKFTIKEISAFDMYFIYGIGGLII